jgi:hypothetical protein
VQSVVLIPVPGVVGTQIVMFCHQLGSNMLEFDEYPINYDMIYLTAIG